MVAKKWTLQLPVACEEVFVIVSVCVEGFVTNVD
jgi:hypothetical protein